MKTSIYNRDRYHPLRIKWLSVGNHRSFS